MYSGNRSGIFGRVGIFLSLLVMLVFVADAAAQCYCKTTHRSHRRTVSSHRVVKHRTVAYRPAYAVRGYTAYNTERVYPASARYVVVTRENRRLYDPEFIDESPIAYDADYHATERIARDYGYKDGWIDGRDAGMERDVYHPENSGDFQKATNGYEGRFGDKHLYRQAYRAAYLNGYRAGFRSIASRQTLRAVRNY